MNYSKSRMPNGNAPAGGSPRAPERRPGNETRLRALLGYTRVGIVLETGRAGGSGPRRSRSPQSGRADGRGDH